MKLKHKMWEEWRKLNEKTKESINNMEKSTIIQSGTAL